MAACFLCGWTTPHGLRLRKIPQFLLAQRQTLVKHADNIKHLIRDSFLDGAVVEPGMYRVTTSQRTSVRFTRSALKSVLSKEEFDRIEQLMPRQTENQVTVKFTGSSCAPNYQPLHPFAPICEMKVADVDRVTFTRSATPILPGDGSHDDEF